MDDIRHFVSGQEAFDELVDHFLGPDYCNGRWDWIQNGHANTILMKEIKKKYPSGSIRKIPGKFRLFRKKGK